jgi:hypothetical protein
MDFSFQIFALNTKVQTWITVATLGCIKNRPQNQHNSHGKLTWKYFFLWISQWTEFWISVLEIMYFNYFTNRSQVLKISFTTVTFTQKVTFAQKWVICTAPNQTTRQERGWHFHDFPFCVPPISSKVPTWFSHHNRLGTCLTADCS